MWSLITFGTHLFEFNIIRLCILVLGFFVLFELVPLPFGITNTIKKNLPDLFRFQIWRGIYAQAIGVFVLLIILYLSLAGGVIDLRGEPLIAQVLITYLSIDFTIYLAHLFVHRYRVPLLSKAHGFHHTITTDMEWVNSRKEHVLILGLFATVFSVFLYAVYRSSPMVVPVDIALFLLLNAFSHYNKPVTIPYLDQVFLFPKDHLRHHTQRSGPYGVTLSLFDTIFGTRDD